MDLVFRSKSFQFYDTCFITYPPGDDLFGMFPVVCLDDRPATMMPIVTAPFEVMDVACRVDLVDDGVTIVRFMG